MKVFASPQSSTLSSRPATDTLSSATIALSPSAVNLQRLVVVRAIVLIGLAFAAWVAVAWLRLSLPVTALVSIMAGALAVNALTWARLRLNWAVGDIELFSHLAFDVLVLASVFYLTGGSTNPFTALFLLPLTLTAAALPSRYTWSMVVLTVTAYLLLLFYYVPLFPHHHMPNMSSDPGTGSFFDAFKSHVVGMWIGFLLSAVLIAHFAVRMYETLRERDRLRAEMRERELRHERVLALGTLAAGAAHELSTPLSTIAVVAAELERDPHDVPERASLLRQQVTRCKEILDSISAATGETRAGRGGVRKLDVYLAELIERWRTLHAAVKVDVALDGPQPAPQVVTEQTLSQALLNILNNAADAPSDHVRIQARWSDEELVFEVCDKGPGLTAAALEHAGEPFFSTKRVGENMGLGLFLARGTIERMGGAVTLANQNEGGAVCRVWLPLAAIAVASR